MTDTNTMALCPFCGAGTTEIRENGKIWLGMKYGEPASVSVFHHCDGPIGQPHRAIERIGKDLASAIAAWNRRASAPASQPAGLPAEPVATYMGHRHTPAGTQEFWGVAVQPMPEGTALFSAAQVQAMLAAAPSGPAPLTDEQIQEIISKLDPLFLDTPQGFETDFARAIERAHGITAAQKEGDHG